MKTASLLSLLCAAAATAAEPHLSTGRFTYSADGLLGESAFHWQDLDDMLSIDVNADGRLSKNEFDAARGLLAEFGEMLYSVTDGETAAPAPETTVNLTPQGNVVFDLKFTLPRTANARASSGDSADGGIELEFIAAADFSLEHQHAFRVVDDAGAIIVDDVSDRRSLQPLFPTADDYAKDVLAAQLLSEDQAAATPVVVPSTPNLERLGEPAVTARSGVWLWLMVPLAVGVGWIGSSLRRRALQ